MIRSTILLSVAILLGGAVADVGAQQGPADDAQGWGETARGGLRARLTLQSTEPEVGKPLLLKLEIRNFGEEPQSVDDQFYAPFRCLELTGPDGQAGPMIGPTPQTVGGNTRLKPGESLASWKDVDAAKLFLLSAPGRYAIQVRGGKWGLNFLPASNRLEFQLRPGELTAFQQFYESLASVAPEGWRTQMAQNAFYVSTPAGLKKDIVTVQVWFSDKELPKDFALGSGQTRQQVTPLGPTALGFAYVAAPQRAQQQWPEYEQRVKQAVSKFQVIN